MLSIELLTQMSTWAREEFPREACGLLMGRREEHGTHVAELSLAANLRGEDACKSFEMDPRHLLQTEDAARARSLQVVGLWHSHPGCAAVPSESDRSSALEAWSYPIIALDETGSISLRSWRLADGRFQEEQVQS